MALWNGQKAKESKNPPASTHRFSLRLEEPTDAETNEFSYAQLILQDQVGSKTVCMCGGDCELLCMCEWLCCELYKANLL